MPKAAKNKRESTHIATCDYAGCTQPIEEQCAFCGAHFCADHLRVYHERYACSACVRARTRKRLKMFALASLITVGVGILYEIVLSAINESSNINLVIIGVVIILLGFAIIYYGFRYFL